MNALKSSPWRFGQEIKVSECWTKIAVLFPTNHRNLCLLPIMLDFTLARIAEFLEIFAAHDAMNGKSAKSAEKPSDDNIGDSFPTFHLLWDCCPRQSSAYTDCTSSNRLAITTT